MHSTCCLLLLALVPLCVAMTSLDDLDDRSLSYNTRRVKRPGLAEYLLKNMRFRDLEDQVAPEQEQGLMKRDGIDIARLASLINDNYLQPSARDLGARIKTLRIGK